jgi:hypothetical protein
MALLLVNLCYSGMYVTSSYLPIRLSRDVLHTRNPFCWCRYAFPIKCTEVILDDDKETVLEIRAEYDASKTTKPKVLLLCWISCLNLNFFFCTTKLNWCLLVSIFFMDYL